MTGFYCCSPSWGGLELNVLRLAGWLTARGHQVTVLTPSDTPLARHAGAAGLPVETVEHHRKYFDFGAARRLRAEAGRLGIRTLFVFHRDDLDVASWTKAFAGRAFSLVYQQQMQLGVSRRDPVHTLRYSRFDAWITPLEGLRSEVLRKTRVRDGRIHVIPLGVDADYFGSAGGHDDDPGARSSAAGRTAARNAFGVPPGGTLFGIIGRLEPGKGQAFLVRAVKRLRDAGHDARLLIMGDATIEPGGRGAGSDYHEQLRGMVRELGLTGVVWLLPHTGDPRRFYCAVDACVTATASETYGMVTLEAMASGTPVIGTDSGGTPEILEGGRCGLLFKPGDEQDFTKRAEIVIRGEYPAAMLEDARRRVRERFSHERECAMIEALMRDLGVAAPAAGR